MEVHKVAKALSKMRGENPMGTEHQGESIFPGPRPQRLAGMASSQISVTRNGENWTAYVPEAESFIDYYNSLT